jgi:hypothetical protein
MLPLGTEVPMHDGTWTVVDRRFVLLVAGQIEVYTLRMGESEIRLMRSEVEANKQLH